MGWLINPFRFGGFSNLYSMLFDGVNEYLTVTDHSSLDFEYNNAFSVSLWVNFSAINRVNPLINKVKWQSAIEDVGWYLFLYSDNKLYFDLHSLPLGGSFRYLQVYTNMTFTTSTWYHVVVTKSTSQSASGVKIYINGTNQTLTTGGDSLTTTTILNNDPLRISYQTNGASYGNQYIDEVSIWNKELSGTEVTELYNSGKPTNLSTHSATANLVSWWRMGEGATWDGSNWSVPDDSTNSNTATSVNMENGDRTTTVP